MSDESRREGLLDKLERLHYDGVEVAVRLMESRALLRAHDAEVVEECAKLVERHGCFTHEREMCVALGALLRVHFRSPEPALLFEGRDVPPAEVMSADELCRHERLQLPWPQDERGHGAQFPARVRCPDCGESVEVR